MAGGGGPCRRLSGTPRMPPSMRTIRGTTYYVVLMDLENGVAILIVIVILSLIGRAFPKCGPVAEMWSAKHFFLEQRAFRGITFDQNDSRNSRARHPWSTQMTLRHRTVQTLKCRTDSGRIKLRDRGLVGKLYD
eukprot:908315-Rhodomonas_salina.1